MENMGKGKHFELTTMSSCGNSQTNRSMKSWDNVSAISGPSKMSGRWLCQRLRDSIDVSHDAFTAVIPLFQ